MKLQIEIYVDVQVLEELYSYKKVCSMLIILVLLTLDKTHTLQRQFHRMNKLYYEYSVTVGTLDNAFKTF